MVQTTFDPTVDYQQQKYQLQSALDNLGYGKRFEVTQTLTKKNVGGSQMVVTYKIRDKVTGKVYNNIPSAMEAINVVTNDIRKSTTRQRNVDSNAKPVSVQKGSTVSSRKSQYYNSVGGYDQSKETEWNLKLNNARKQVSDYNRRTGQERIKVETYPDVKMVFFVVTLTGEKFYDFNMAKACADELIWNKAKHSSEDIGNAIYHCLIDDDFMNLRMSQLRS